MNATTTRRMLPTLAVSALLADVTALPAAADQDPGPLNISNEPCFSALARVGTQYVAGDNLTGNGVPAPAWVVER